MFVDYVAERVVRTAPCPVLTVRHPEHEFVFPNALVAVAHRESTTLPPEARRAYAWRVLTQLFLEELDREAARTRRALEQVPTGRDDWKPHPKSMPLGRLAGLVASMPSWVSLIVDQDELDLTPPPGQSQYQQPAMNELVQVHEQHVAKARETLAKTTDDYLMTTNWRLRAGGKVVLDQPRHLVLRDTINHLAHHRGQLTVYLRLTDRTVPAIYGPSADDQRFD